VSKCSFLEQDYVNHPVRLVESVPRQQLDHTDHSGGDSSLLVQRQKNHGCQTCCDEEVDGRTDSWWCLADRKCWRLQTSDTGTAHTVVSETSWSPMLKS